MKITNVFFNVFAMSIAFTLTNGTVEAQSNHSQQYPQPNPPSITRIVTNANEIPLKKGEMLMAPSTPYSHGDPTAMEQLNLEYINQARANPTEEGIRLANTPDQAVQGAMTFFSINKALMQQQFASYPAKGPLAFNAQLIQAARLHSEDMRTNQFQGHTGSNGSSMGQRINQAGYTGWSGAGENVFSYAQSVWHAHAGFNVDWGGDNQVTLGHRENIMNYQGTQYREIGVGILNVQQPSQVGPLVVTQNFGLKGNTKFITGVVYKDLNNNNFYDIGEGLAGVQVMPASGTFYAVTSTSGGYAIPYTANGSMTVTASGGDLPEPIVRNIQLSNDNVKLDFILGQGNFTPNVVLNLPTNGAQAPEESQTFQWFPGQGATEYQFEISTSPTFTSLLGQPFVTQDTSRTVTGLINGTIYYWRVRANGPTGWSQYSSVFSFERYSIPSKVVTVFPMNKETLAANSVLLTWMKNPVQTAKYWVELSSDEFMDAIIVSDSSKNDTSRLVENLQPGTYYWWVHARNEIDWTYTSFNEIQSFTISAPGVPTTLVAPPDKFTSNNGKVTLMWSAVTGSANPVNYKIYIADNEDFTDAYTATLSSTQFLYETQTNGTYYWKIENNANGAMGAESPVRTFVVDIPTSVGNTIDGVTVSEISPNPFTSLSSVTISTEQQFDGIMHILDVQGNVRGSLGTTSFSSAQNIVQIPSFNLPVGVYFLRIQHPKGMIMKKFIIAN
jgi:hypothetical protein